MSAGATHRTVLRAALAIALLPAAVAIAACGDDEKDDSAAAPAPSASEFPEADGRTVDQIYGDAVPSDDDTVVAPAGKVANVGTNRFGFAVFNVDGSQVTDAEVAIYAGQKSKRAEGPFPARIESLETDPEFTAQTSSTDPDTARVVYVSELELDKPGQWDLVALLNQGETTSSVLVPGGLNVDADKQVPAVGDEAPEIDTATADEVVNLDEIDTRDPHDTMHEENFSDVVGEKPVVLTFATPLLCQSRVCGPVVDVAEQVKADHEDDDIAFIHQEIYEDNDVNKGLQEQPAAYGLPTEPWVFVIDEDGTVSSAIEGALSVDELEQAVDKVTG